MKHDKHCIIIGEAKCGTSSLHKYLVQHPEIIFSPKQVAYLSGSGLKMRDDVDLNEYFKECGLKEENKDLYTIDGASCYFRNKKMPEMLTRILPDAKLILMFRNPIDRMYSNYWMNRQYNRDDEIIMAHNFDELIGFKNDNRYYIDGSINHYLNHIKNWYKYFTRDRIYIIKSEDMFSDLPKTMDDVYGFLNLETVQPTDIGAAMVGKYPEMDAEIREYLVKHYLELNKKLYDLIGRDMGWDK